MLERTKRKIANAERQRVAREIEEYYCELMTGEESTPEVFFTLKKVLEIIRGDEA